LDDPGTPPDGESGYLIYRADLLRGVVYPEGIDADDPLNDDSLTDGDFDSATDDYRVTYTYWANSARRTSEDQNGTAHTYTYDDFLRLTNDEATTLGTGVDDWVREIVYAYDDSGRYDTVTSYQDTSETNVENQLAFTYDAFGNVTKEQQEHFGAVDGSTSAIEYRYDTTLSGNKLVNGNRANRVEYPNGRYVHFTYGKTDGTKDELIAYRLSRLNAIQGDDGGDPDDDEIYAAYSYVGLGLINKVAHPGPSGLLRRLGPDIRHGRNIWRLG